MQGEAYVKKWILHDYAIMCHIRVLVIIRSVGLYFFLLILFPVLSTVVKQIYRWDFGWNLILKLNQYAMPVTGNWEEDGG